MVMIVKIARQPPTSEPPLLTLYSRVESYNRPTLTMITARVSMAILAVLLHVAIMTALRAEAQCLGRLTLMFASKRR